ncbi:MAG: response regulator [Anaerolineae bacterium]|nr:response regulator [Anaerolineae bacterium]
MNNLALVIEDEVPFHMIYDVTLKSCGFDVIFAQDGQQALDILVDVVPDIIFLDMLLPQVNGEVVLSYIQKKASLANVPVVIVSAHNRFTQTCHLRSIDHFLLKPVRPDELRETALRVIPHP